MRSSLLSFLPATALWLSGVHGVVQIRADRQNALEQGSKDFAFKDLFPSPKQELLPKFHKVNWINDERLEDGHFTRVNDKGELVLEHAVTGQKRVLVDKAQAQQPGTLNADRTLLLRPRNVTKGYRYSFTANYDIVNVNNRTVRPLTDDQQGDIQFALWNPKNPVNLVFVRKNNIFFWNNGNITQVTKDGSDTVFNGIPDWVYEEEVIGSQALWFSPDGKALAYLRFDDTNVPLYTVPYYFAGEQVPPPYPKELKIRYPKPGFPNPIVNANIVSTGRAANPIKVPLDVTWPKDDIVVGEVAWTTASSQYLTIRCFNRVQNADKHILVDLTSFTILVVRERNATDGWIENSKAITYVGQLAVESQKEYYVDLSDEDGWMHIYMYSIYGGQPRQLTKGKYDVRAITKVDYERSLVYYQSTEGHPTESRLDIVNFRTGERVQITPSTPAYWTASFSPNSTYFVLNYEGPNLPYQEIYSVNNTNTPIRVLEDNSRTLDNLRPFQKVTTKFFDITHPDGVNLSAKLQFPSKFDETKKYPVLLTPYGGPDSQEVRKTFSNSGPKSFLGTNEDLQYVTFTVDNRGTGFRGRAFRNTFYKNMGMADAGDQIWAAEWLAKTYKWVDADRIGIWGWSNGGYLSAKVVEWDSDIISFAMITAPTWDMRLYDSIYTERYLGLPKDNKEVYDRASIRNVTGFKNIAGGVLIQHGMGDDNVHISHSAALVDILISGGVPPSKLSFSFFPDSEHNIRFHNHYSFVIAQLTDFLMKQKKRTVYAKEKGKANKRYAWDDLPAESTIDSWTGEAQGGLVGERMLGNTFYGKELAV